MTAYHQHPYGRRVGRTRPAAHPRLPQPACPNRPANSGRRPTSGLSVLIPILGLLALLALSGSASASAGQTRASGEAPGSVPGDWPMYGHDPSRTNTNPDETTITRSNAGSLVSRWQVNIGWNGGPSSSTPSVANGRVYVGSSVSSGHNFFAFDAVTGRRSWSVDLHYVYEGCFDVGIGSTATISGTNLVVGGGDDAYYGLDALTGALIWRNALNAGASAYPWISPVLANGRAYVGVASRCDNPSVRGEVRAIDLTSRQQVANQYFVPADQAGAGIWNSPALSPDGNTLVVATGEDYNGYTGPYNRALVTLDPTTLAIREANQQGALNQDLDYGSTPVIFHDSQGRVLVGANHKDGTFYAFELANLSAGPIWHRDSGTTVGMMPAYDASFGTGGTLFFAGIGGNLYAVDPASGSDRWPPVYVGTMHDNLAIANGLIFINTGSSGLQIREESTGLLLTTLTPAHAGPTYSGVAVAHGFVYWVSGPYLNAWSVPGAPPSPAPCAITFADVHPADYFYTPVQDLACRGVVSGYGDGTFHPYANTTRAQLVKIAVNAFGVPPYSPPEPTFDDVPEDNPFYSYVETAVQAGIISGYGDGTFRPNNPVTRGQLAKIITAAAGWGQVTPASATFADVPPSSPFYPFVQTAVCHGVISGYTCGDPGEPCDDQQRPYYRPGALAVRGQIAKIVYNGVLSAPACQP